VKFVHLLQNYHSHFLEAQFCRSVFVNVKDFGVKKKWEVWWMSPQSPLLWLKMHLPILSLLWATRNFEVHGSFLQDIVCGRKCLGQTSLNLTETDSKLIFFHTLLFLRISMQYAIGNLRSLPIRCTMQIPLIQYNQIYFHREISTEFESINFLCC